MGLTVKRVTKLTRPGRYFDERGLYVQVRSASNRSWLLRYEIGGRERWAGLGPLADFTLDEARERARKARQLLADGLDPLEVRKKERRDHAAKAAKTITFKEAAEQYATAFDRKWKNEKHRKQFLSTLRAYAFPKIGALPIAEINTALVRSVLIPIWETKTETASRVRQRIEVIWNWAKVLEYCAGDNPARWAGNLDSQLPSRGEIAPVKHHSAMPYDEVPGFIVDLRKRDAIAARALEFTILCAARTGEVIGARWDEIDLAKKTWTVPASRMKAKVEHRVPLSDRAIAILKVLPREGQYVFVGGREGEAMSNMGMAMLLRRMDIAPEKAVVHGFRSAFRDWAAENTNFPNHVCEMALAHSVDDKVEKAYRRGDLLEKRKQLMAAWSKYIETPPRAVGTNVTPLGRERR
jgi:integrase